MPEDKIERFAERAEAETGHEIWVDTHCGDDLGWFFVETPLELQGVEFEAKVDFNLSESDVSMLYAEITLDPTDEKREAILDEVATCLGGALYEYHPDESEVGDVVEELRKAHSEIYG